MRATGVREGLLVKSESGEGEEMSTGRVGCPPAKLHKEYFWSRRVREGREPDF